MGSMLWLCYELVLSLIKVVLHTTTHHWMLYIKSSQWFSTQFGLLIVKLDYSIGLPLPMHTNHGPTDVVSNLIGWHMPNRAGIA